MKNVFNPMKGKQAKLQRNAFDLSHSDVFSIAPGMLLPIHVQEVNPSEHFEINPSVYVRTMPLNTASFVRAKQHLEFYFVPMRCLARQWNQFIVGTDYKVSGLSTLNGMQNLFGWDLCSVAAMLNSNTALKNIFGLSWCKDAIRLLDMLGYGVNSVNVSSFSGSQVKKLNLWRLLAYQKIYYDHYRNPDYEVNDPTSYNVDDVFSSNSLIAASQLTSSSRYRNFFTLRYRNWNKDYFTCASPYWLGSSYTTTLSGTSVPIPSEDSALYPFEPHLDTASYSAVGAYMNPDQDGADTSKLALSVANLRSAFALDKMYRLSIAASDGDYGSQIKAHYGFNAVHDDWKSVFIGGTSAPIQISEVLATAESENVPVGDICGKGSGLNQGRITYDAKEHGIIIGIMSISPLADYESCCIDKFNSKFERTDYFQPEFADLGKQAITQSELMIKASGKEILDNVLGFVPRYMEYKTSVDKVHGQFVSNGSLSAWAAPRNNPTISVDSKSVFTSTALKIDPRVLNPICTVTYDGTEKTDQFIVDSNIGVSAIRPMSVSGEPML